MTSGLLNYLLYQTGWLFCVLGAARGAPWAGTLVAAALLGVHLGLARCRRDEVLLAVVAGTVGFAVDSLQQAAGLLRFPSGHVTPFLAPAWIAVLWMQMAGTLHFCLSWLSRRYRLVAGLGAVGGPLAFAAGSRLGAVGFHDAVWPSVVTLALVWGCFLPLLMRLADRLRDESAGRYVGLS